MHQKKKKKNHWRVACVADARSLEVGQRRGRISVPFAPLLLCSPTSVEDWMDFKKLIDKENSY